MLFNKIKARQNTFKDIIDNDSFEKQDNTDSAYFGRKKSNKSGTKFAEFNFHVPARAQEKRKTLSGLLLLEKFLNRSIQQIISRSALSRKKVNKIIINIYNLGYQHLSSDNFVNLIEITYEEFSSHYALKAALDKKFIEFIASVVANGDFKRCSMYLKLINYGKLISAVNYSKYSVNLYLLCFQYLTTSKLGIYFSNDEEDKNMIPTIRAIECVKEKLDYMTEKNMVLDMINKIEQKSQTDPRKINAGGVVEMESVLELILDNYETYTSNIFNGINLCLIALGYNNALYISSIDFQIILRILCKNPKEMGKEISIEEILLHCFKYNIGQEEEILKFSHGKEQINSLEYYETNIKKVLDFYSTIDGKEEKYKTYDYNMLSERIEIIKRHFEKKEFLLAYLGLIFCLNELDRLIVTNA